MFLFDILECDCNIHLFRKLLQFGTDWSSVGFHHGGDACLGPMGEAAALRHHLDELGWFAAAVADAVPTGGLLRCARQRQYRPNGSHLGSLG